MRDYPELFNLDLLSPTRRAWKMRIESCRLSNVEQRILGLNRENDLPGAQVPERYFQYLKTGDLSLAVSYTHLDVYKRQIAGKRGRSRRPHWRRSTPF